MDSFPEYAKSVAKNLGEFKVPDPLSHTSFAFNGVATE